MLNLTSETLVSYHKHIDERIASIMSANGYAVEDLVFVVSDHPTKDPGKRYTDLALEQFQLTAMGGRVFEKRWLMKKADVDRLQREEAALR